MQVELDGAYAALSWSVGGERRQGTLALPKELAWTCHRGETDPIEGWYSPRFGRRVPATSLVGRGTFAVTTRLVTDTGAAVSQPVRRASDRTRPPCAAASGSSRWPPSSVWPLGAAYVVVEPPPLTSTTLVLLPTPALAESSNSDVDTQVRIALSASILEQAGQAVDPVLPVREVEKMVDVTAPTNQLHPDRRDLDRRRPRRRPSPRRSPTPTSTTSATPPGR